MLIHIKLFNIGYFYCYPDCLLNFVCFSLPGLLAISVTVMGRAMDRIYQQRLYRQRGSAQERSWRKMSQQVLHLSIFHWKKEDLGEVRDLKGIGSQNHL